MARIFKVFSGVSLLFDLPASGVDIPKANAGSRPALPNTMRRRHAPRGKCRAATRESMHGCSSVSSHGNDRVILICCTPPTNTVTLWFHPFLTFLDTSELSPSRLCRCLLRGARRPICDIFAAGRPRCVGTCRSLCVDTRRSLCVGTRIYRCVGTRRSMGRHAPIASPLLFGL
jgi:hypothetical protein